VLRKILEGLESNTSAALEIKKSATMMFFNEWGKLFLETFDTDRKVVYTSVYAFPMELLYAFDTVAPFDFEIAGTLISGSKEGISTMEEAENHGYSPDICSFHRTAMGAAFRDYFPEPDLLLTTSYYCEGKAKTNELLSSFYNKESGFLSVPSYISKDSVRYVEKQLRKIASQIEELTGEKLDEDRLKEVVKSSNRSRLSHLKMLDLLKHCPAPWGGRDMILFSIIGLMFAGNEAKERLNTQFAGEMEQRIATGKLRPEKHRIYWFAWTPTYNCNIFDILKENEVSIPLCETFRMFWDEIDEDNPFEGLALKCLKNPFVGSVTRRLEGIEDIKNDYNIDGAILFSTPACTHSKSTFRLIRDSAEKLGINFLMLDLDISDPRGYSPEQIKTRLESFIEIIEQ
jgi:benzoyl-CoA reductase/2-hydroxyglutaryl-CoA dehydratase subunit BcrC/BadD/HgdB